MHYQDEVLSIELPSSFGFKDRPNYCTWNFVSGAKLICVCAYFDELSAPSLVSILCPFIHVNDKAAQKAYIHELQLQNGKLDYGQRSGGTQLHALLKTDDLAICVTAYWELPSSIVDLIPCLEGIRVSKGRLEADRDTFVPKQRRPEAIARRKKKFAKTTIRLPSELAYLQTAFNEFLAMPPEDLGATTDTALLEEAIGERLKGVDLADAEKRMLADNAILEQWLERRGEDAPQGYFLTAWLTPFVAERFPRGT